MTPFIVMIIFLPLIGAILSGMLGCFFSVIPSRVAQFIPVGCVSISAFLSGLLFWSIGFDGNVIFLPLFSWFDMDTFSVSFAFYVDTVTLVMMGVVTFVSALVHIYSLSYMNRDPGIVRFITYLSLFTFFMLFLVSSMNLVQLFLGWEGVGLMSYFLIGFWYTRPEAGNAAQKAFIMNRCADLGFILALAGL